MDKQHYEAIASVLNEIYYRDFGNVNNNQVATAGVSLIAQAFCQYFTENDPYFNSVHFMNKILTYEANHQNI
jgi:hypothetical protein